jgi:N-acetylmuramoyl-L-alanine amidase
MRSTKIGHTQSRRAARSPSLLLFCFVAALFLRSHAAAQKSPAPKQSLPNPIFVIVIDPAHGGADTGARLADGVSEKDSNLALAQKLHALLDEHGFTVIATRKAAEGEAEADLTADARAAIANHAHAQACLVLHATATGNGIHLFTSSLTPAPPPDATHPARAFTPWETAQASSVKKSIALAAELNAAFTQAEIPVTVGRTLLPPLDSMTCPVVAVEIAPLLPKDSHTHPSAHQDADNPEYSERVAETLTWALQQWRNHTAGVPILDQSLNPQGAKH